MLKNEVGPMAPSPVFDALVLYIYIYIYIYLDHAGILCICIKTRAQGLVPSDAKNWPPVLSFVVNFSTS